MPSPTLWIRLICYSGSENSGKHLLAVTSSLKNTIKDTDEHPDGGDAQGKVCRKRSGASMPPLGVPLSRTSWKPSEPYTFGILWRLHHLG